MVDAVMVPFSTVASRQGDLLFRPLLSIQLSHNSSVVNAIGLLDTGADVNVLPFSVGVELGADWDSATRGLILSGNLASHEARGLIVTCKVGALPEVRLAFAWVNSDSPPLILGQVNFFSEFDVCFYRTRGLIQLRSAPE